MSLNINTTLIISNTLSACKDISVFDINGIGYKELYNQVSVSVYNKTTDKRKIKRLVNKIIKEKKLYHDIFLAITDLTRYQSGDLITGNYYPTGINNVELNIELIKS